MINSSLSILTRGRLFSGITPFSSGFILTITEEIISVPNLGGKSTSSKKQNEQFLKKINVSLYINNEQYKKSIIVKENIKVTIDDILIEWNELEKPIIKFKGII